jgi:hypothetical protein
MEKNLAPYFPFVGVDPSVWLIERAEAIDSGERIIPPPFPMKETSIPARLHPKVGLRNRQF